MEFPIWLILALISPAFWAIVHVLDSYCVDEVFDMPWVGLITSSLSMLTALPFLSGVLPFTTVAPMSGDAVGFCILSGVLYMASQLLYFHALATTESGIVAAYWNFIPLFLILASNALLGEVLSGAQYAGSAVLIASSVAFCLLDGLESRWLSFWMMLAGALLQVAYFLIQKRLFASCPVYQAFLVTTLSMAITGLSPMLLPRFRCLFLDNLPRIRSSIRLLLGIEMANLAAVGTSQYAVSFGAPSLVSAVEASIPGYTLLISLILYATTRKYGEEDAKSWLSVKLLLVGAMVVGVWLVS